jgi:uncharacterized membrane protein YfcA
MITLLIIVGLGGLIGALLGLTGAGGGILAVPALTLGLGWSMTQSAPIALMAVASAACIGMLSGLKQGLVRFRAAFLISFIGILVAPIGQALAHQLPQKALMGLFACVMLIVAARLMRNPSTTRNVGQKSCLLNENTGRINWNITSFLKLSAIGSVSGLATGLLGVGGGFIIVPALLRCSNITINGIVATSLMVITLISTGTVLQAMGSVNFTFQSWTFIIGAVLGMIITRPLTAKIPALYIQRVFVTLIICVSLIFFYKVFF